MLHLRNAQGAKRTSTPRRGFTIVELLIVVVVIAILAAIVTVAYNGIRSRAAEATLKSDLSSAAKVLENDKTLSGSYPGSVAVAYNGKGLPKSTGTNYQYTYDAGENSYCLTITSDQLANKAFFISSQNSSIQNGVCSGHVLAGVSCPPSPVRWTPRTSYASGDCVVVGSTVYSATAAHPAHGPRFIQATGGYWNGGVGVDFDWAWPSQAQAGDLILIALWSGTSASCTPTNTVSVGGTSYPVFVEHLKTSSSCYRGQLYLIPYSSTHPIHVDTDRHVSISAVVLRDTVASDISIARQTASNTVSVGEWDPTAKSLTYNGMILTVGIPRASGGGINWTWAAQHNAASFDSFFTGWADYENTESTLVITAATPNPVAVWTLFVTQPAFNSTGWIQL